MRVVVVVASLTACFSKPPPPAGVAGDGGRDAEGSDAAISTDGSAFCTQWGPFGTPIQLVIPAFTNTGAQNVTISNDGLELIFDQSGSLFESVRTATTQPFNVVGTVPGFDASPAQGAWLSLDRRILFYINGANLFETDPRATSGDAFVTPGRQLFMGADDATATTDRLRVVFSVSNALHLLKFISADDTAPTESTLVNNMAIGKGDYAPSIGDHGRKVIWSQADLVQPMVSVLFEADFDGNKLTNARDLSLNNSSVDTDPNLSDDGTTMYFTSTRNSTDPTPQLFVTTRTCIH